MSLELLRESYTFGNLDIVFTPEKLRTCNLEIFNSFPVGDYIKEESFSWRMFNNFNFLLNCYERYIYNKSEKFVQLIDMIKNLIDKYSSYLQIKNIYYTENPKKIEDFFCINVIILYHNIFNKLNIYLKSSSIDASIYNKKIKDFELKFDIFFDNVVPFEDSKWTSKWKIIANNYEIELENVDIYLDSYFKNYNIYYNPFMKKDIQKFNIRLKFLKNNAPSYYDKIKEKILIITEKIFYSFPYKYICNDYRKLLLENENIYQPDMISSKDFSNYHWILSIIPKFLTAYILGMPIVKFDVPGKKILLKKIKELENLGPEKYYKHISEKFNQKNLESFQFDIEIGNAKDDEDILDLCYLKIKDYNQDDIMSVVNENVIHHFSCKEFETIWKKQENPYNREKITNLTKIIENLKFKKRVCKNLILRGLYLELNGTMIDNFNEILENIEKIGTITYTSTRGDLSDVYRPLIEIFLSNNNSFV